MIFLSLHLRFYSVSVPSIYSTITSEYVGFQLISNDIISKFNERFNSR